MAELSPRTEISIDTTVGVDSSPVLSLAGELDSSNADALRDAVATVVAARPQRLVFDLGGLRFMDSAGIAVLLSAATVVDVVELRHLSAIVRRIIELTGLTTVFQVEP
jgi:anti-sigma B factor antagonist